MAKKLLWNGLIYFIGAFILVFRVFISRGKCDLVYCNWFIFLDVMIFFTLWPQVDTYSLDPGMYILKFEQLLRPHDVLPLVLGHLVHMHPDDDFVEFWHISLKNRHGTCIFYSFKQLLLAQDEVPLVLGQLVLVNLHPDIDSHGIPKYFHWILLERFCLPHV